MDKKRKGKEQQGKKQDFGHIWVGIWLPILGAVVICLIVGTVLAYRYEESYQIQNFENMSLKYVDFIWELQEEYASYVEEEVAFEDTMAALQVYADDLYKECYDAYVMDEQGKIVLEGKETVYLVCFDTVGKEYVWLRCGDEEMTQQILQAYEKYTKSSNQTRIDVVVDEVYIEGKSFYPVRVNIYSVKESVQQDEQWEEQRQLEETIVGNYRYDDLSSEAICYTGLEETQIWSYTMFTTFIYDCTYDDGDIPQVRKEAESQVLSKARDEKGYFSSYLNDDIVGEDGKNYFVSMIPIILNGEIYYLIFTVRNQPLRNIMEGVILAWLLGIFGSLILSWAIAMGVARIMCKEQELVRRQQAYTNALAHDLKTPLMAISGYTENLEIGLNPEKQEHYFQSIHANIDYINQMVGDMLELAKVAHVKKNFLEDSIELRTILDQILQDYEQKMQEKKQNMQINGTANIKGNSVMIQRLFQNLIDNAVKFSPEGECVQVVLSEAEATVTNTGVSVPKEDWERVFEPFAKVDEVRRKKDGTGLGLSIVKDIAQLHGFSCSMESTGGSTTIMVQFGECSE